MSSGAGAGAGVPFLGTGAGVKKSDSNPSGPDYTLHYMGAIRWGTRGTRPLPQFSDSGDIIWHASPTFFSLGFVIYWFHTKLSPSHFTTKFRLCYISPNNTDHPKWIYTEYTVLNIFSPFRIFEQLALALKNRLCSEFTVLNIYFLSFRNFEQLALALKFFKSAPPHRLVRLCVF